MMQLASNGRKNREGTRMGLWGAGQAVAAGNAMIFSTLFVDLLQTVIENSAKSYGIIFVIEGILFLAAAVLATRLIEKPKPISELSHGEKV
jgi:BCD family chlorophyll transporter-like MFS transporter